MRALARCEPIQPDSLFSASTSTLSFILNATFNPQTLASASATVPTSAAASVPASASALSPDLMPALSLSHKQLQLERRSLSPKTKQDNPHGLEKHVFRDPEITT